MLIDAHVHLNNYHEHADEHAEVTRRNVADLFAKMQERSVDHAVVITSYRVDPDRPSVEQVLDVLAGDPRVTIVEGIRWTGPDRTDLGDLEERIAAGSVRGVKFYPGYEPFAIDDPALAPVYDIAVRHKIPVLFHTGDTYARHAKVRRAHPLLLDDVAVDHPDVTFVMCHAGNPWFIDAAEVIYKNENVYADISGLTLGDIQEGFEQYMRTRLRDLVSYMGAAERRLMFGTDWPLVRMAPYLDFLDSLEIDDEDKECMRWKTARDVYGIDLSYARG